MNEVVLFKPRELQDKLYNTHKRWNLTICHRRFGKTVYEINKTIRKAVGNTLKNPRYAYIAPFRNQAKLIAWDYLKEFSKPIPGVTFNESELRADYPNGARIQLFGADKPDGIRGVYMDGVVLDEYAQIKPSLFGEVIRPLLSDRKGWCDFTGTPKGRNHFWELFEQVKDDPDWSVNIFKASETGIIDPAELDSAQRLMSKDQYEQEFECSWTAAIQGAYYADIIAKMREDGQITRVPYEPSTEVNTFWDLGRNDTTAIWFHQQIGREHRFIDFYENNGEGLAHYAKVLKERDYLYGRHYLPHDVEVTELTTNTSRKDALENMGVKPVEVIKRVGDINHGIELTRQKLPTCWIDKDKCHEGLRALENYQKEWDDKRQVFRSYPLHNWASNPADAFRQFAQSDLTHNDWGKPIEFDLDII